MTIEELLDSLRSCDTNTVARVWLPEMQKRCSSMKVVLKRSQQSKDESGIDLKDVGNVSIVHMPADISLTP